jgi:hypothetical protein
MGLLKDDVSKTSNCESDDFLPLGMLLIDLEIKSKDLCDGKLLEQFSALSCADLQVSSRNR